MAKRKRTRKQRDNVTPERARFNDFASMGMARRVLPVIDQLHGRKILNDMEYTALAYYRDQASLADHSPVRSCCDNSPRSGNGPGIAVVSASIETGRLEREMGQLWEIARKIAVEDWTIERWCMEHYGSKEFGGKVMPINPGRHVKLARMELRMAARRIAG